jgi:hypothetical protein
MTLLPDPASVSVRKIDRGEFTENCQSNSISVSGFANGTGSNVRHHSVSDSMFSSAELNSLGHEKYNDKPRSWRRSCVVKRVLFEKIDRGEFTENCQSNSISVSGL